jgi:hypothetical protein
MIEHGLEVDDGMAQEISTPRWFREKSALKDA